VFFRLFTLCSDFVSALLIVLIARVKESENGRVSDFERRQIVGARLAGASVIKNRDIARCIESDSF
jgi:hypothetical protein